MSKKDWSLLCSWVGASSVLIALWSADLTLACLVGWVCQLLAARFERSRAEEAEAMLHSLREDFDGR